jgi:S-adenosylmethionine synthetase
MLLNHSVNHTLKHRPFDVVEIKGCGHPDTICDSISTMSSELYSRYTKRCFGHILNHYFDNISVVGGNSIVDYGIGELLSPIKVYIHGAASTHFAGESVPVRKILDRAAKSVFERDTPRIPFDKSVRLVYGLAEVEGTSVRGINWFQPNSKHDLPTTNDTVRAVDTSCVTAFWPFSTAESVARLIDQRLSGEDFHSAYPYFGTDYKVLVVRTSELIDVTVNIPVISECTKTRDEYVRRVGLVRQDVLDTLTEEQIHGRLDVTVNPKGHPYMSVYSGALELRDIGSTGRGNRYSGFISTYRPSSMECPYGKSPTNYGGRTYYSTSKRIAMDLHEQFGHMFEVSIVSRIHSPMDAPTHVLVESSGEYCTDHADSIIKRNLTYLRS